MRLAPLALALPTLLAPLAGCATLFEPTRQLDWYEDTGLLEAQPAEIAVLPVRDRDDEGGTVPVDALRVEICEGLVDRRYSPLALDYVDRHWSEASWTGEGLSPEATFELVITRWDDDRVRDDKVIEIEAEAYLRDAHRPDAEPLWTVSIERAIDVGKRGARVVNLDVASSRAAEGFVDQLLLLLPRRDPSGTR